MKHFFQKKHTLVLIAVSLLLTFAACQEEEVLPNAEKVPFSNGRLAEGVDQNVQERAKKLVKLEDDRLVFGTRDAFEEVVGSAKFDIPTVNEFDAKVITLICVEV